MLSARHQRARLQYARIHLNWTSRQWANVLFTDESWFCLHRSDAFMFGVGRDNATTRITWNLSGRLATTMVWGGITVHERTNLVTVPPPGMTAVHYVDEILHNYVIPMRRQIGRNFMLM